MKVVLCDINENVVDAWKQVFDGADVTIQHRNILELSLDAVVAPGNSFGFMTGGIDLAYAKFFPGIEAEVRQEIEGTCGGELLVGQAFSIETKSTQIPWLIYAPTMRVPATIMNVVDVYLATRAALAVAALNQHIERVGLPGMGTGTGMVHPMPAARVMKRALEDVTATPKFATLHEAYRHHHELPLRRPGER